MSRCRRWEWNCGKNCFQCAALTDRVSIAILKSNGITHCVYGKKSPALIRFSWNKEGNISKMFFSHQRGSRERHFKCPLAHHRSSPIQYRPERSCVHWSRILWEHANAVWVLIYFIVPKFRVYGPERHLLRHAPQSSAPINSCLLLRHPAVAATSTRRRHLGMIRNDGMSVVGHQEALALTLASANVDRESALLTTPHIRL